MGQEREVLYEGKRDIYVKGRQIGPPDRVKNVFYYYYYYNGLTNLDNGRGSGLRSSVRCQMPIAFVTAIKSNQFSWVQNTTNIFRNSASPITF